MRRLLTAVTLLLVFTATLAVPAQAAPSRYAYGSCGTSGFNATFRVGYDPYGGRWAVKDIYVLLTPADGSRISNNVDVSAFGVIPGWGHGNPRVTRNGQWTYFYSFPYQGGLPMPKGSGGRTGFNGRVIFDRFGSDPRCSTTITLP